MLLIEENVLLPDEQPTSKRPWKFESIEIVIDDNLNNNFRLKSSLIFKLSNILDGADIFSDSIIELKGIELLNQIELNKEVVERLISNITQAIKSRMSEVGHKVLYDIEYVIGTKDVEIDDEILNLFDEEGDY